MAIDVFIAALTAWREASGEGSEGMRGVLHVINNRSKKWGKSVLAVCTQRNQFSSMVIRGDANTVRWPIDIEPSFAAALAMAQAVLDGTDSDVTDEALYYANEATMTSGWYKQNITESNWHPVTVVIGQQTFRK